jgi:hypothetical protein
MPDAYFMYNFMRVEAYNGVWVLRSIMAPQLIFQANNTIPFKQIVQSSLSQSVMSQYHMQPSSRVMCSISSATSKSLFPIFVAVRDPNTCFLDVCGAEIDFSIFREVTRIGY